MIQPTVTVGVQFTYSGSTDRSTEYSSPIRVGLIFRYSVSICPSGHQGRNREWDGGRRGHGDHRRASSAGVARLSIALRVATTRVAGTATTRDARLTIARRSSGLSVSPSICPSSVIPVLPAYAKIEKCSISEN